MPARKGAKIMAVNESSKSSLRARNTRPNDERVKNSLFYFFTLEEQFCYNNEDLMGSYCTTGWYVRIGNKMLP